MAIFKTIDDRFSWIEDLHSSPLVRVREASQREASALPNRVSFNPFAKQGTRTCFLTNDR
jgi:hypothetical protein